MTSEPKIRLSDLVTEKGPHGQYRDNFIAWAIKNHKEKLSFGKLNGRGHKSWIAEPLIAQALYAEHMGAPTPKQIQEIIKKQSPEEMAALEWEKKSNYVFITKRKGCPDLIIIPLELLPKIIIREIKTINDKISIEQYEAIRKLQREGLDADFQQIIS